MKIKFAFTMLVMLVVGQLFAQSKAQGKLFNDATSNTKVVAKRYVEQYAKMGFDSMALDMADNISVEDPTARILFDNLRIEGKEKAVQSFKANYTFFDVSIPLSRSYFSGNYGIFEGVYKFSAYADAEKKVFFSFELPITIIIKVENGKVVEHRDYADYVAYSTQYQKQIAQIKPKANGGQ